MVAEKKTKRIQIQSLFFRFSTQLHIKNTTSKLSLAKPLRKALEMNCKYLKGITMEDDNNGSNDHESKMGSPETSRGAHSFRQ